MNNKEQIDESKDLGKFLERFFGFLNGVTDFISGNLTESEFKRVTRNFFTSSDPTYLDINKFKNFTPNDIVFKREEEIVNGFDNISHLIFDGVSGNDLKFTEYSSYPGKCRINDQVSYEIPEDEELSKVSISGNLDRLYFYLGLDYLCHITNYELYEDYRSYGKGEYLGDALSSAFSYVTGSKYPSGFDFTIEMFLYNNFRDINHYGPFTFDDHLDTFIYSYKIKNSKYSTR